jgi:GTPase SAR1 family protein
MAPNDASPSHSEHNKKPSLFAGTYSLSTKKLNEITKLLRHCGLERVVPPLPTIAVIGNQSAGKSSLIEAISKIKVPRSKGTTTRCPMEVVLRSKRTDDWSCAVKLRLECSSDVPKGTELGTFEFAKTQIPEEVSLIIRRAQLAILNPGKDPKDFLAFDEAQCHKHTSELPFSRNMVVVEIIGADVDVTFIDLPGLIANTPDVLS